MKNIRTAGDTIFADFDREIFLVCDIFGTQL